MEVSLKSKNRATMWPGNFTSGCEYKEYENTNSKRYMDTNVHSIIYSCQEVIYIIYSSIEAT